MLPGKIELKKALNKAYFKQNLKRAEIDIFKNSLKKLFSRINENESEEHLKNVIADFLKETWYNGRFEINTHNRIDLAIHNGKSSKDTVGVILEAKRPSSPERMTLENLNCKALHELILYYFEEREELGNIEVKNLIATNVFEWFLFDENEFDKAFYRNTRLQKLFKTKKDQDKDNPFFYSECQKILAELKEEVPFTWFNLKDFEASFLNHDSENKLIELYKILSPEHLLKLPFANDSNSLNKEFYNELLHIIGLEEYKEGSKKIIIRKKAESRYEGSLLENTISILQSEGCMENVSSREQYGADYQEQLFSIGLELCINWLNRILFLKLLEGQLISYHNGNKEYAFLNSKNIRDFDELNELFFEVLAIKPGDRTPSVTKKFGSIPYLNSSLFERSDLETKTIRINSLKDRYELPVYKSSVIRDDKGTRVCGNLSTLKYLFDFLDSYDFASESTAKIQEQNKTIINASVLGLIFEKINGYKDGSFFTPGFITTYMCRETIRRAVVQKFNDTFHWSLEAFEELKEKVDYSDKAQRQQANDIINSIKICDPAVGSGHFLVSALNEIIAIKNELQVLQYQDGSRVRGYKISIENDELIILDEEKDSIYAYVLNQNNKPITELQKLQQALFHEKQTIIENCLFGVDINPKSVLICRLRLWIELLKNAYYIFEDTFVQVGHALPQFSPDPANVQPDTYRRVSNPSPELQTLPNIDINIKCGNSLISRFPLDADLSKALKSIKYDINAYRGFVLDYKNASDKELKKGLLQIINSIKNDFRSEIQNNDPKVVKLKKLSGDLYTLLNQKQIFELSAKEMLTQKQQADKLQVEINKLSKEIEEIKDNAIYRNAFEWRFEFPEVLDDNGDFIGFDVVIGNPPYIRQEELGDFKEYLSENYHVFTGTSDILVYFFELGMKISKNQADLCLITSNKFMKANYGKKLRNFLSQKNILRIIDFGELPVFDEAATFPAIFHVQNNVQTLQTHFTQIKNLKFENLKSEIELKGNYIAHDSLGVEYWSLSHKSVSEILKKMNISGLTLGKYTNGNIFYGIKTGFNKAFIITEEIKNELISNDPNSIKVIFPFAIGDDIRKYLIKENKRYIIFSNRGIDIDLFPAVKNYLEKFKQELTPGIIGGRKPGTYKWYELQDTVSYYEQFHKPKIIFPDIAKSSRWAFSDETLYIGNTAYFIPLKDFYLLGVMNSKAVYFYYSQIASVLGDAANGGRLRWIYQDVIKIPVPNADEINKNKVASLVDNILSLKQQSPTADTSALEAEIDQLVYQLYGLTEEEIAIVEKA